MNKCTQHQIDASGAGRTIIRGANIHISLLTDCKNNRFQKKLITQNTNILIFAPPIIDLPAPLLDAQKHAEVGLHAEVGMRQCEGIITTCMC